MSKDDKYIGVDADSLIYMAGHAVRAMPEHEHTLKKAKVVMNSMLRKQFTFLFKNTRFSKPKNKGLIQHLFDTKRLRFFLTSTDKSNFRFKAATTLEYKSSRKTAERPLFYEELRQYLTDKWNAETVYGMEADDMLSIMASEHPGKVILLHVDKDLRQIPDCYHCEMNCERKIYYVNHTGVLQLERTTNGVAYLFATGKAMLMAQMLTGDATDDIPRLKKGFGPVKVYEYLTSIPPANWEFDIMELYKKEYGDDLGPVRYRETYRLVSLLTIENYQDEVKTIKITTKQV